MAEPFPSLFAPLKVGTYTLKNRIMNTGHAAHFQTGDGIPTDRYVDYVRERAKGGVGIIVTGFTVTRYDGDTALSLANYDERITTVYGQFSEATHAHGVPMLAQLGHRGRRVSDGARLSAANDRGTGLRYQHLTSRRRSWSRTLCLPAKSRKLSSPSLPRPSG